MLGSSALDPDNSRAMHPTPLFLLEVGGSETGGTETGWVYSSACPWTSCPSASLHERSLLPFRFLLDGLILHHLHSAFLTPHPFNTAPHVVLTPIIRLCLLLLHNCNLATLMTYMSLFPSGLRWPLWKGHWTPGRGLNPPTGWEPLLSSLGCLWMSGALSSCYRAGALLPAWWLVFPTPWLAYFIYKDHIY